MSTFEKLLQAIRRNPRGVRFDDLCRLVERLGFQLRARGGTSHRIYSRIGVTEVINLQQGSSGTAKPYQVRQILALVEKYKLEVK